MSLWIWAAMGTFHWKFVNLLATLMLYTLVSELFITPLLPVLPLTTHTTTHNSFSLVAAVDSTTTTRHYQSHRPWWDVLDDQRRQSNHHSQAHHLPADPPRPQYQHLSQQQQALTRLPQSFIVAPVPDNAHHFIENTELVGGSRVQEPEQKEPLKPPLLTPPLVPQSFLSSQLSSSSSSLHRHTPHITSHELNVESLPQSHSSSKSSSLINGIKRDADTQNSEFIEQQAGLSSGENENIRLDQLIKAHQLNRQPQQATSPFSDNERDLKNWQAQVERHQTAASQRQRRSGPDLPETISARLRRLRRARAARGDTQLPKRVPGDLGLGGLEGPIEDVPYGPVHSTYNQIRETNLRETNQIPQDPAPVPSLVHDECCPSIMQIVQPRGGVSKDGRILELYRDGNATQSFYQLSCADGYNGQPCQYIHPLVKSRCIQRFSYTYALVREFYAPKDAPWRLDYIRIRSGCACEVRYKALVSNRQEFDSQA